MRSLVRSQVLNGDSSIRECDSSSRPVILDHPSPVFGTRKVHIFMTRFCRNILYFRPSRMYYSYIVCGELYLRSPFLTNLYPLFVSIILDPGHIPSGPTPHQAVKLRTCVCIDRLPRSSGRTKAAGKLAEGTGPGAGDHHRQFPAKICITL